MAGKPLYLPDLGAKGQARPTTMEDRQMDPVKASADKLQDALKAREASKVAAPAGPAVDSNMYDEAVGKANREHMSAVLGNHIRGPMGKYPPAKGYGR